MKKSFYGTHTGKDYVRPGMRLMDIKPRAVLCQSTQSHINDVYEEDDDIFGN